ncbi:MAG: PAS domain S-box protein [Candidatus Aminicenantes bacterium]|nr:PAS domain S-box protein [Candidatus Aminicenantes bacterium]
MKAEITRLKVIIKKLKKSAAQRKATECPGEDALEELRKSEEKYKSLTQNINLGIYRNTTGAEGKFIEANPAIIAMFGYDRKEEFLAINVSDLYRNPEDRKKFNKKMLKDGIVKGKELWLRKKDGSSFVGSVSAVAIKDEHGQVKFYDGIIENITDRKLAESRIKTALAALGESEERFRTLYENSALGIYRTNPEGRVLMANPALIRMLGYSCFDELASRNLAKNGFESSYPRTRFIEMIEADGEVKGLESAWKRKDGATIFVRENARAIRNVQGGIMYYDGTVEDITEHKRALIEMESLALFPAENPNPILRVNRDGTLLFTNQAGVKLLPDWNLVVGEPVPQVLSQAVAEAMSGNSLELEEIAQGSHVLSFFVVPVMSREYANIYGLDVTKRKRAEAEKRILEERLQWAEKMEAIGTLAGGIAHDFNNLLLGIQGYVSLSLLNLDPSHPNYERLKRIEAQVQSGAELTSQLLGFARGGRYEVKPTDMNDIIEKTSSMFGRTKKEISIHRKLEKDLWGVEVDRGQMEQVFVNLYVNAWQAMPKGGAIYLETENIMLTIEKDLPYSVKPGQYVKITVTDTGKGMDEKIRGRIFDPFFTTKEMGRGTGLGLATVYGIVKGHQGMINVYSEPGHGSSFSIYLPASNKDVQKDRTASEKIFRGKGTVLLVEDEKIILDVNKEMLESLGYEVYTAGSGQDGLAVFKDRNGDIDLVILDMIMPGLSGGETFDRFRKIDPTVKVLLSSGYSLNGEAQHIMDRGCNGFLQKPYQIEILSKKIREILGIQDEGNAP